MTAFTGFESGYMPVDTVDETAQDTGMAGPAAMTSGNLAGAFGGGPTRSLVVLWFLALGLYWAMGWMFKGERS